MATIDSKTNKLIKTPITKYLVTLSLTLYCIMKAPPQSNMSIVQPSSEDPRVTHVVQKALTPECIKKVHISDLANLAFF